MVSFNAFSRSVIDGAGAGRGTDMGFDAVGVSLRGFQRVRS